MADTEFLTFLVDETLKLHSNEASELTLLEQKLNDYQIEFVRGEFIPQTQMLRFRTTFGLIDIPFHWSVFANDSYSVISSRDDKDLLLSVMKKNWNPKFEKLLVTFADGFSYVIGLKTGEEAHVRDLVSPPVLLKSA